MWKRLAGVVGAVAATVLGAASSEGAVEYYHSDVLGSVRAVSDQAGVVVERHDYLPFGEECIAGACASDPGIGVGQPKKFTGKERDSETGLDYFGARYHDPVRGRFTSPDPASLGRRHVVKPQKWNRYSYVLNNPMKFVDPDGLEEIIVIVNTFIPMPHITAPGVTGARYFRGDNRRPGQRGTFRTHQRVKVETDHLKNGGKPVVGRPGQAIGTSHELSGPGGRTIGIATGSGSTLTTSVSRVGGAVTVGVSGNEPNPLVTGGPGITYNFSVSVTSAGPSGAATVTPSGEHDGFPGYEIMIVRPETGSHDPQLVYSHDPTTTGEGASSLLPPAEHTVRSGPVVFERRE